MRIGATVSFCNQVGPDEWKMGHYTNIFDEQDTFEDVFKWARRIGGPNAKITINDIKFSEVSE